MSRRAAVGIAAVAFTAIAVLQLDFWRPQQGRLLLGWLPEELAYRLVVLALAWVFMLFICALVWREQADG